MCVGSAAVWYRVSCTCGYWLSCIEVCFCPYGLCVLGSVSAGVLEQSCWSVNRPASVVGSVCLLASVVGSTVGQQVCCVVWLLQVFGLVLLFWNSSSSVSRSFVLRELSNNNFNLVQVWVIVGRLCCWFVGWH